MLSLSKIGLDTQVTVIASLGFMSIAGSDFTLGLIGLKMTLVQSMDLAYF